MKTIGLIGGMSWESTVTYYQLINSTVKKRLGGLHSAKCLLYSVDFHEIEQCQANGDWEKSGDILADAACRLEKAGADFIVICTNTMHKVADQVAQKIRVPLLHIADATADVLKKHNIHKTGVLGTKYTMQQDFYKARLVANGFDVLIPCEEDMELVNAVIYDELCRGIVNGQSKKAFLRIIEWMERQGADGVILGCTEIGLLVKQSDTAVPLFDTAAIHAEQAALFAIE